MKYLQRLESGDKIFLIDDNNQIKEIRLKYEHLKEDEKDRHAISSHYQLKSNTIESGGYIPLTTVTRHEEMVWNGHHTMKRWFEYEDTDKVAYLSFDEAQCHLNDMIYQRSVMTELQEDANLELESHLAAVKSVLSNYFDRVDRHDIEATILNNDEEHKRLLELRKSIC